MGTVIYIWRLDENDGESLSARVVSKLAGNLKYFSTREMRRRFIAKYGSIKNPSKAILRQVYQELTHDSCAARTSEEAQIDERVATALLNAGEQSLVFDLRKLNGRPRSATFDVFWDELTAYLQEVTPAVDERRHGEVHAYCYFGSSTL